MVKDDVDRIEIVVADAVAGENARGESALQGCETEKVIAVAAEDELDEAVAESADAVVEEDGVGHATSKTLAPLGFPGAGCDYGRGTSAISTTASRTGRGFAFVVEKGGGCR